MSDEWAIATTTVEPARIEPGELWVGIAQHGDIRCRILVQTGTLAEQVVEALNEKGYTVYVHVTKTGEGMPTGTWKEGEEPARETVHVLGNPNAVAGLQGTIERGKAAELLLDHLLDGQSMTCTHGQIWKRPCGMCSTCKARAFLNKQEAKPGGAERTAKVHACCGCSCHVCENGHQVNAFAHTDACQSRFFQEQGIV